MSAHRFRLLAEELRSAALGSRGNPPGVSRHSMPSLSSRIEALASYLPARRAVAARVVADRLAADHAETGLTAAQTLELAAWLEVEAVHSLQLQPLGGHAEGAAP